MRLLITGARGFVGSSLAEYAANQGHEILGIGRTAQAPPDWSGNYAWADVALSDLVPIINGFQPDLVAHCAGSASVGGSFISPLDDFRANVLTLANTLDGIRRSNERPLIVFPSSAAVYGNPARLPVREDEPCRPISPYGFHKLAAEQSVSEYIRCYQLRAVICRVFSVIGERQKRLLLWDLCQQFLGPSEAVVLQGTGDETRDFLHISELCDVFIRSNELVDPVSEATTVNVASGVGTTVRSLALLVKQILGSDKPLVFRGEQRLGDPTKWVADCGRLQKFLPRREGCSLAASVEHVVNIWKNSQ
jgi:UDP-glucose 4-epimerase